MMRFLSHIFGSMMAPEITLLRLRQLLLLKEAPVMQNKLPLREPSPPTPPAGCEVYTPPPPPAPPPPPTRLLRPRRGLLPAESLAPSGGGDLWR
ncbi:hypothetical protein DAI22_06g222506 [Oryza sativa Japonica Group]|nr:hypothetical protein DAI22_06g222506 [Oryza sativa Japonica Group]